MRRLAGIQYARAAAALAVTAYHACARTGLAFGCGPAGVDVFFVISGFVIWTSISAAPPGPLAYAWRRIVRIVPLYWGATLALVAVSLLSPRLAPHVQTGWRPLLLSLGFVPYRGPDGQIFPVLVAGWTLNFEMFFYALCGATLLLPRPARLAAILGVLGALATIGWLVHPTAAAALTYTSPLLVEFGAGVALGWLWEQRKLPPGGAGAWLIGGGMVLLVAAGGVRPDARLLLWGAPAMLIVAGVLTLEQSHRMPRWRWAEHLGDASFSIYLLHPLLISALLRWQGLPAPGLVALSLVLSCAVGIVCHTGIERPVGRWLGRLGRNPPAAGSARFAAVDGLRGLAAVAVLMTHAAALFRPVWIRSAYLAVDLFFMLSGFVLAHAYGSRLAPAMFMKCRLRRLMPLYLLGSAIGLLAALAQGGWSGPALWRAAVAAAVLVPLPSLAGAPNTYAFPLNPPAWTLVCELGVNVLYAAIAARLTGRLLATLLMVSLAGLVIGGWWHGSLDVGSRFSTMGAAVPRCVFLFFLGVALHRRRKETDRTLWFNPLLVLPGLLVLLWLPVPSGARLGFDLLAATVVLPMLVLLATRAPPMGAALARCCGEIGGVSFALYAIHVPLLCLIEVLLPGLERPAGAGAPLSGMAFLLIAAAAAMAADRGFDRPLQRWLKQDRGARAGQQVVAR